MVRFIFLSDAGAPNETSAFSFLDVPDYSSRSFSASCVSLDSEEVASREVLWSGAGLAIDADFNAAVNALCVVDALTHTCLFHRQPTLL